MRQKVTMKIEPPQMLDTNAAANLIGARPSSLKRSRVNGELYKGVKTPPFVKMGKAVRYHRSDLDAWLKAHTSCYKAG
jgi:predicted DNA-binding transcriptional regulator AlpA